tara:strand:+ start:4560 stop:5165 length:606 start_codon:yes stop_codon:yes gene_type:complete
MFTDHKIPYKFFHWGPFLNKTKIIPEEVEQIKSLCEKNKNKDYRKNLAGLIEHEYEIDRKKLLLIINKYVKIYCKAYYDYSQKNIYKELELTSAWVNYMTKFESNPIHSHTEDISFVLFTEVPKDLKKEYDDSVSSGTKPGCLNFILSLSSEKSFINEYTFFPEIGDLYIFPSGLSHFVSSFKCEGERVSVSGNFKNIVRF